MLAWDDAKPRPASDMNWSARLQSVIHYGTEGYPPRVARRLRAVNITTGLAASLAAVFAIMQFLDPTPGIAKVAAINAFDAVLFASIPLLHRFGPRVAAITLVLSIYASHFIVISLLGSVTGMAFHYLVVIALLALFFGTGSTLLAALLAALGAALIVAVETLAPRNTGLLSDSMMFVSYLMGVISGCAILFWVVYYMARQTERAEAIAEREHRRSEELLALILPGNVAARLKDKGIVADRYADASILFADMAGFTARASDTDPEELVRFLNEVFSRFDGLVKRHGLEKIKTTGDAYMVVSGVPAPRPDHAEALADLALDLHQATAGLVDGRGRDVPLRMGIAAGPVVAGVIGTEKFFYDVWGDAVNTASRMESTGEPGRIQVAPEMYERLKDRFEFDARGVVEIRGKGLMRTWFLTGRRDFNAASSSPRAAARSYGGGPAAPSRSSCAIAPEVPRR
jgi:adenylate cyclase